MNSGQRVHLHELRKVNRCRLKLHELLTHYLSRVHIEGLGSIGDAVAFYELRVPVSARASDQARHEAKTVT